MKYVTTAFLLVAGLALAPALAGDVPQNGNGEKPDRIVVGYAETITLLDSGLKVDARMDSGANTSSMHALNIEYFEREGDDDEWVSFVFEADGESISLERPLTRHTRIVQHSGERDRRPVVELEFCLDGIIHRAEFNLTDRSELTYPVLLGRRFLADAVLIDPAVSKTLSPGCP